MKKKRATGNNGRTALHNAVIGADILIVRSLLQEDPGIVRVKDRAGQTALHFAVALAVQNKIGTPSSSARKLKVRKYVRIARFLLDNGASATVENKEGKFPGDYLRTHMASIDGELVYRVKMPELSRLLLKAEKGYRSKHKKQRIAEFDKLCKALDKDIDKEIGKKVK